MASVDPQILSPRDALKDSKIRLDGPLMTGATKFGVQCLNLPQSASVIKYLAGIDGPTYDQVFGSVINEKTSSSLQYD